MDECCICLEELGLDGVLTLSCGHAFHARTCLLASFSGEVCTSWRCPLCRTPVVKGLESSRAAHARRSITYECMKLENGSVEKHVLSRGATRWDELDKFFLMAYNAVKHYELKGSNVALPSRHGCLKQPWLEEKSFASIGLTVSMLEKLMPDAATGLMIFNAHYRLQRILDPASPHPFFAIARYLLVMLVSLAFVVAGIVALHALMGFAGRLVCWMADSFQNVNGHPHWLGSCFPMAPDGWFLPVGFAILSAYIAIQIAIICGADGRQIILKWDKGYAWRALLLWFVVCLAYTAFVYVSRLLLTLLVGFVGSQTSRLESLSQLEESSFSA